jgi:hypothetical protein
MNHMRSFFLQLILDEGRIAMCYVGSALGRPYKLRLGRVRSRDCSLALALAWAEAVLTSMYH